jgi:hypothetical protein
MSFFKTAENADYFLDFSGISPFLMMELIFYELLSIEKSHAWNLILSRRKDIFFLCEPYHGITNLLFSYFDRAVFGTKEYNAIGLQGFNKN